MSTVPARGATTGLRSLSLRGRSVDPVAGLAVALALVVLLALLGPAGRVLAGAGLLAVVAGTGGRALAHAWARRTVAGPVLIVLALLALLAFAVVRAGGAESVQAFLADESDVRDRGLGLTSIGLALSGPVLLFVGVRAAEARRRAAGDTPWRSLVATGAETAGAARSELATAGLGAAMVLTGVAIYGRNAFDTTSDVVASTVVIGLAVAALVGGPVLLGLVVVGRRDRAEREVAMQRQAVAAHLHDSVLQTFALIQRSLDDPERVRRLVRTQERDLRAWLAGREVDELDPLLSGSLRRIADLVEEEHGVTIELDVLDDPPVLEHHRPLLEAAREALRNAARHAGGAAIRVLAETTADPAPATVVYVRDDGPGFAPDDVAPERRGVRDAIVGRMTAAGGSARIDTAAGAGTEVVLTLPHPSEGRGR